METLRNIDWGAVTFIVVAVAVLLLFIQAARRMRKKKHTEDSREEKRRPPRRKTREAQRARGKKEKADRADKGEEPDEAPEAPEAKPAPNKGKKGKKGKKGPRKQQPKAAEPADEATEEPAGGEPAAPDTEEEQRRLTAGLAKTRGGFIARLGKLFKGKQIDEGLLEEVEEVLFTADIGVQTSNDLIEGLRKQLSKKQLGDADAIWAHLKSRTTEMLADQGGAGLNVAGKKPFVLLVIGVNGTGKTTTIGKLAARFKAQGHEVLLAAGDTFRAAAVQQLQVWGERSSCPVVHGKEGADPASVLVDGLKKAVAEKVDVVIADTAGRLHTKSSLMEELQKVRRALDKHVKGAPHETFLVLDATTGQNAIAQAKQFKEAMDITGLVLTKLDGTAKGGVVLGIANELALPVRYIGIGEQIDDLREFDPRAFVEALFTRG